MDKNKILGTFSAEKLIFQPSNDNSFKQTNKMVSVALADHGQVQRVTGHSLK